MVVLTVETLEAAFERVSRERWEGRRCYAVMRSQTRHALDTLQEVSRLPVDTASQATPLKIKDAVRIWQANGTAPATINKRLNCLSALGVDVTGCRVRLERKLKWWLTPDDQETLRSLLPKGSILVGFIDWTCWTGLRVEESLRLKRSSFSSGFSSVTVPGLKTASAQATLPLTSDASVLASTMFDYDNSPNAQMFPITYGDLADLWDSARELLGATDTEGATLKALRRSAARYLHAQRGMPLDLLRQYLRHEDVATTMGYLKLTGGYGEEEMRKWLS